MKAPNIGFEGSYKELYGSISINSRSIDEIVEGLEQILNRQSCYSSEKRTTSGLTAKRYSLSIPTSDFAEMVCEFMTDLFDKYRSSV